LQKANFQDQSHSALVPLDGSMPKSRPGSLPKLNRAAGLRKAAADSGGTLMLAEMIASYQNALEQAARRWLDD
jgi:hypothetical protein